MQKKKLLNARLLMYLNVNFVLTILLGISNLYMFNDKHSLGYYSINLHLNQQYWNWNWVKNQKLDWNWYFLKGRNWENSIWKHVDYKTLMKYKIYSQQLAIFKT
jgi:hypothetical protein